MGRCQSPSPCGNSRWLASVILFLHFLLVAQTLGALHGAVHPGIRFAAATHVSESPQAPASTAGHGFAPDEKPHGVLSLLFAGHESDSDCRAFDQLCHFDAIADFASPALAPVLQTFVLVLLAGLATARWHALHQARGPPLPR